MTRPARTHGFLLRHRPPERGRRLIRGAGAVPVSKRPLGLAGHRTWRYVLLAWRVELHLQGRRRSSCPALPIARAQIGPAPAPRAVWNPTDEGGWWMDPPPEPEPIGPSPLAGARS